MALYLSGLSVTQASCQNQPCFPLPVTHLAPCFTSSQLSFISLQMVDAVLLLCPESTPVGERI